MRNVTFTLGMIVAVIVGYAIGAAQMVLSWRAERFSSRGWWR